MIVRNSVVFWPAAVVLSDFVKNRRVTSGDEKLSRHKNPREMAECSIG